MKYISRDRSSNQLLREKQRPRYVSSFTFVWLSNNGSNVDEIEQLSCMAHGLYTFNEPSSCIDFITDLTNEKVLFIISDSYAQGIVPLISDCHQIYSIYISGSCTDLNKEWTKEIRKVKGVFTEFSSLYDQIQLDLQKYNNNISVTFNLASTEHIQKQDASFMYAELLKEILLYRVYDDVDKREFIIFCRDRYASSVNDLALIDEFEHEFEPSKAIFWYTRDSFIYKMMNKALREQDIDTLYALRSFMHDLYLQIKVPYVEELKRESEQEVFLHPTNLLFRGVLMPNRQFNEIKNHVGGLISFNEFLSTSANRQVALVFAGESNDSETAVLFELTITSTMESPVPFTNIEESSYFGSGESEYLFAMGTVFYIEQINELSAGIWCVQLRLTKETDEQLKILMSYIRDSIDNDLSFPPAYAVGRLLLEMGKPKKAAYYYEQALTKENDWDRHVMIFNDLGTMYSDLRQWDLAITSYQRAITIALVYVEEDDPQFAEIYTNIGIALKEQQKFDGALEYFNRSFKIALAVSEPNPELLSIICSNVGDIRLAGAQTEQAITYVKNALDIALKHLPPNYDGLARCYESFATICMSQGEIEQALGYYEKCVEIKTVTLPHEHLQLAALYASIAGLQHLMGCCNEALINSRKALDICVKELEEHDSQRIACQETFDLINEALNQAL